MCNIAGYVGNQNATPILLKMIRSQEGLNGGFYSGMAVHNGEGIDFCKLRGDFETFLAKTNGENFVGTTGIIHSRTPAGGDDLWAHPFATEVKDKAELCYVANGGYGLYKENKAAYDAIADDLVSQGIDIPCKTKNGCARYNRLSSGEYVHMSDVMCQLIYKHKKSGLNPATAMTRAFCEMPSEVVGLAIFSEESDKIYFSRINKPMFLGFDENGAYLASSLTAFPEGVVDAKLLPPLSSGVVWKDGYALQPYPDFSRKVRGFNKKTLQKAEEMIISRLQKGECGARDLFKILQEEMPKCELLQVDAIVYLVLDALLKKKTILKRETTHAVDGQKAPLTLFCWNLK